MQNETVETSDNKSQSGKKECHDNSTHIKQQKSTWDELRLVDTIYQKHIVIFGIIYILNFIFYFYCLRSSFIRPFEPCIFVIYLEILLFMYLCECWHYEMLMLLLLLLLLIIWFGCSALALFLVISLDRLEFRWPICVVIHIFWHIFYETFLLNILVLRESVKKLNVFGFLLGEN